MKRGGPILVINTGSAAVDHMAASVASEGLLSTYVRPITSLGRPWEAAISMLPGVGTHIAGTLSRRQVPAPLGPQQIREVAVGLDLLLALQTRLPTVVNGGNALRRQLIRSGAAAVGNAGARFLADQSMVMATWTAALPAFEKASRLGIARVLSYPLAHHAFTRCYLEEEARLQPSFADTLNSHDWTAAEIAHHDREIELANYVVVGSSFAKSTFIRQGIPADKVVVIPYGVDTGRFTPARAPTASTTFNVIFAGQISQRKGIAYLLRAFERVARSDTTLTLVGRIVGDGKATAPWRHLFRHVSHIPQPELAQLLRQSDVFVFPTLVEGMGLVVVEALASGLPVITTPNGPGDIVRDGVDGFIVPPRNVDLLAKRIEQLRSDPQLRESMSLNAVKRARDFTWSNFRTAVARMVKDVLRLELR